MATVTFSAKDLICGLCQDVYTTPRFLKGCHHSFCEKCITNSIEALGTRTFRCPICRIPTVLPKKGGVKTLQVNFYLKDSTLDQARRLMNKNCAEHELCAVDRLCQTCRMTACKECTKHEGEEHKVTVMSELEEATERQISDLKDCLAFRRKEQSNLKTKASSVCSHLHHQKDLLHSKVDQRFKVNNNRLWTICRKRSKEVVEEITYLQEQIKVTENLIERSRKCAENGSGEADMADLVRQMELRLENEEDLLSRVSTSPVPHPGLICSTHNHVGQALSDFLGRPVEPGPPEEAGPPPVYMDCIKIPVQIHHHREVHEILGLTPSDDGSQVMISFRGKPSHLYSSVAAVQVEDGAVLSVSHDVVQEKTVCVFERFGRPERCPALFQLAHGSGVLQISKVRPMMCLVREKPGIVRLHHLALKVQLKKEPMSWQVPVAQPEAGSEVMQVDVTDPFNMDVSPDEQFCVVIDRGEDSTISQPTKKRKLDDGMEETDVENSCADKHEKCIKQPVLGAVVKLFRKGESEPFDVYRPTKSSFVPSDVCFCRWKKHRLLIADWQNDEIHVVHVGNKGFSFKRLLAEHHGELVKPTALNTDSEGGVWIGCSNGSLLRYPMKTSTPDATDGPSSPDSQTH